MTFYSSRRTKIQIGSHIIIEHFKVRAEHVVELDDLTPAQLFEILEADIVPVSGAALPVSPGQGHVNLLEAAPLRDEVYVLLECLHFADHVILELAEVAVEPQIVKVGEPNAGGPLIEQVEEPKAGGPQSEQVEEPKAGRPQAC